VDLEMFLAGQMSSQIATETDLTGERHIASPATTASRAVAD
jgi:hypothetical protein